VGHRSEKMAVLGLRLANDTRRGEGL
jgi:hypothetical protein